MSYRRKLTITVVAPADDPQQLRPRALAAIADVDSLRFLRKQGSCLTEDGGGWSWELGDADAKEAEPGNPGVPTIHLQTTADSLTKCGKSVPWALSTASHASANCVPCLRARIREMAEVRLDAAEARGAKRNAVAEALEEYAWCVTRANGAQDSGKEKLWTKRCRQSEKAREKLLDLACGGAQEGGAE